MNIFIILPVTKIFLPVNTIQIEKYIICLNIQLVK